MTIAAIVIFMFVLPVMVTFAFAAAFKSIIWLNDILRDKR